MASELMAFIIGTLDNGRPPIGGIVDLAFSIVVSSHEKGGLGIVLLEDVENIVGINVWPVIVSQGNCARDGTVINACTTVRDGSVLWTSNGRCVATMRDCVIIASRTVVVLTTRGSTIVCSLTAPASFGAAVTCST